MTHIAIVGAGITGVTTAYALLKRGYQVTVFDQQRYAAMKTSYANGGQLSASNAEVWTQTSTVLKGLSWMLKKDAPLLVNPKPSWHKYTWMTEFLSNIPHYQDNTIATVRLAIAARNHLYEWADAEGIEFDLEQRGILHFYTTEKSYRHALHVNTLLDEGGLKREPVSPAEMKTIEPTLHGDFYGGFFTDSDATGDIHKYTRGLADACKRLGARFIFDAEVNSLQSITDEPFDSSLLAEFVDTARVQVNFSNATASDSSTAMVFDGVVVSAGIQSRALAKQLGDRVNVYPVKGYSITVNLEDESSQRGAPWVSLLDDDAKVVTSRLGVDRFRIAGTAEFNGENYDIRHSRIQPLVNWCRDYFPQVNTDKVIAWAGLRPMMPNMMPKVGAGHKAGVFYNTGHGHLGWTLSAATADMIAANVQASIPADLAEATAPVLKAYGG